MDKNYDHSKESEIYDLWEKSGAFKASKTGKPYTILMPPPNANASLHAGHAMYTIDDILIRFKRMQGFSALWIPGTDHAGFETQFVYEKALSKEGKSRTDFDRQTLYKNIFDFVKANSGLIFKQFKRLGFTADWDRNVFTLDEKVINTVFETFKKMVSEKLVYRDSYIVNYCPHCGTSLADLEVKHLEKTDPLYYVKYPLANTKDKSIIVATVRPETIFADVAIAVNPKDKRYIDMTGKTAHIPLINREIPIIADDLVDISFGTGALKITPGHDPVDFDIGKRHGLETISVIDLNGKMKMPAGFSYPEIESQKAQDVREIVVSRLKQEGFLDKIDSEYLHSVVTCYKCGRPLEPTVMPNWFIKVAGLKDEVKKAVEKDLVKFYPPKFKKHMLSWLNIMHDWPISRQIVWGIRIPVWYKINSTSSNIWVWWLDKNRKLQQGNVRDFLENDITIKEIEKGLQRVYPLTGPSEPEYVISKGKPRDENMYLPETDTFDTWFSSGQWPIVTLKKEEFESRFPTDLMGTLSDILKFWVSRMIMFSLYLKKIIPFKNVYLWSMVADAKGIKMSKSKGNVTNPVDLIDKYGADALRMSLLYGTPAGSKVILSDDKVRAMRNFSNKLWNIARYIQMVFENTSVSFDKPNKLNIEDSKLLKELNTLVKTTTNSLESYKLNTAIEDLYEFTWHEFADKYVESTKEKARNKDVSTLYALRHTYLTLLKLLHPFAPFVTEAVWKEIKSLRKYPDQLLITSPWPKI